MWARCTAGENWRILGLDSNHLEGWLTCLDDLTNAGNGAAGANAGNQDVCFAIGIVPDFLSRGKAVNFRVSRIFKLLWNDGIRVAFGDFFCLGNGAFHTFCAFRQNQFCTEQLEQLAAFNRHGFRHGQNEAITLGGCRKSQCNTGVAGSRFHKYGLARNSFALCFKRFDQRKTDTVLNARQWIEEFELDQKVGFNAIFLGKLVDAHERCIADRIENGIIDATASCGLAVFSAKGLAHGIISFCLKRSL